MNYARAFGVDVATWQGFWWMVTGQMFSSQMFAVPLAEIPGQVAFFIARLFSNFIGVSALVGILGVVDGFRQRPDVHLGLAAIFLGHLAFVLTVRRRRQGAHARPDVSHLGNLDRAGRPGARPGGVPAGRTARSPSRSGRCCSCWPSAICVINFNRVDLSHDWSARRRGEELFDYLPPRAVYVGGWGDVPILDYLQLVEKQRDDVETLNVFLATERPAQPIRRAPPARGAAGLCRRQERHPVRQRHLRVRSGVRVLSSSTADRRSPRCRSPRPTGEPVEHTGPPGAWFSAPFALDRRRRRGGTRLLGIGFWSEATMGMRETAAAAGQVARDHPRHRSWPRSSSPSTASPPST